MPPCTLERDVLPMRHLKHVQLACTGHSSLQLSTTIAATAVHARCCDSVSYCALHTSTQFIVYTHMHTGRGHSLVKVGNQPTSAAWHDRSRKLLPVQHTVLKPSCPAACDRA